MLFSSTISLSWNRLNSQQSAWVVLWWITCFPHHFNFVNGWQDCFLKKVSSMTGKKRQCYFVWTMFCVTVLLWKWQKKHLGGEKCQHLQNGCDCVCAFHGWRPHPYLLKARFIMVWVLCHQRLDGDEDRWNALGRTPCGTCPRSTTIQKKIFAGWNVIIGRVSNNILISLGFIWSNKG